MHSDSTVVDHPLSSAVYSVLWIQCIEFAGARRHNSKQDK